MAGSRYLKESGAPDGYQLEDGSGVLLLEGQAFPGAASGTGTAANATVTILEANPNQFNAFRRGEPYPAIRGKVNEWGFDYYRKGEALNNLDTSYTSPDVTVFPEVTSGTGTAAAAAISIQPNAGASSGTGTSAQPTPKVQPSAQASSGTGTAANANGTISASIQASSGTGTAGAASASLAPVGIKTELAINCLKNPSA